MRDQPCHSAPELQHQAFPHRSKTLWHCTAWTGSGGGLTHLSGTSKSRREGRETGGEARSCLRSLATGSWWRAVVERGGCSRGVEEQASKTTAGSWERGSVICTNFMPALVCLKADGVWALFHLKPELFQPSDSVYFCPCSWHFSFRWLLPGLGWGCGLGRLVFSSSYRYQDDVLLFFAVTRHPAPLPSFPSFRRLPEEATDGPVIWFHSLDWSNTCPPLWGQEGLIPNRARSQRRIWSPHANRAQDKTTRPCWAGKAKSVTRERGRRNQIVSEEIKKCQEIAFSFWVGCYCGYWSVPPWRINWEYWKIMADTRTHLFTLKGLG